MPDLECDNVVNHIYREYIAELSSKVDILAITSTQHSKKIDELGDNHERFKTLTGTQMENHYKNITRHLDDIRDQIIENKDDQRERDDDRYRTIQTEILENKDKLLAAKWQIFGICGTVGAIVVVVQFLVSINAIAFVK